MQFVSAQTSHVFVWLKRFIFEKTIGVPEISRFYGIVIMMFFNEHSPPHFHVNYGEYRIVINLQDELVQGYMPKRALKLVFEWMELHKVELMENWLKCQNGTIPDKIEPLK